MDPSTLAERVRGILGPAAARAAAPAVRDPDASRAAADVLGGEWQGRAGASWLAVERRYAADERHGADPIGRFADALHAAAREPAFLGGQPGARPPFLFFDLETTGLSGGAGTLAFLVGCGRFDEDGAFRTRQYLLTRTADERPMLEAVARDLAESGALVSFNGRSFDAPLLETRYLFHRLAWVGEGRPHVDMLHPARRFWRDEAGCSLGALERQVLGARRSGDVPGFEIPGRYFQFLRDGDARPLGAVLEHNRLDLLSLAGLLARFARLTAEGPDAARDAREALALGHVFGRTGDRVRARQAFERAASSDGDDAVRAAAWQALALDARRRRAFDESAACWRRLLTMVHSPPALAREAAAALAVHYEHRARDLDAAKAFALRSLRQESTPSWDRAVRHRLSRLDRKMGRTPPPLLE